jgi:hypothetical protein
MLQNKGVKCVKVRKAAYRLVIRTIPVWNLSIRRTRRPNIDVRCRNKELVPARDAGSRKFLNVT